MVSGNVTLIKTRKWEALAEKIAGMIPAGSWLPFCKVELKTAHTHLHTSVYPLNLDTKDDLLRVDEISTLLREHRDEPGLQADFVNYSIGAGSPAPMPTEVFSALKQIGRWWWHELPHFSESSVHTIKFADAVDDCGGGIATDLMPKSLRDKLRKRPLYSTEKQGKNAEVVVKYFNPSGAGTWLITEGEEQQNGDWMLYGICHIHEWEWGYVMLSELASIKLPYGLRIERDLYSHGTVAELMGEFEEE